jgi:Holliday junction DNA helicase RuvA
MISRLRGTVVARTPASLVLDVGGVGYLLAATPRVTARVGEEATVETHLHVREDALQLYGFASGDERELFELLLGVSGIGPKVALAIVSGSPPADSGAIARDDLARFRRSRGRKTASGSSWS